jgi:hypothetical protein
MVLRATTRLAGRDRGENGRVTACEAIWRALSGGMVKSTARRRGACQRGKYGRSSLGSLLYSSFTPARGYDPHEWNGKSASHARWEEVMRQYSLRSILALIGVIALSIWVGMQIERAASRRVSTVTRTYTITSPSTYTSPYTVEQMKGFPTTTPAIKEPDMLIIEPMPKSPPRTHMP